MTTTSFTLRDILRIFFSHKIFFVVFPVILTISAFIGSQLNTPRYEARVKMFIKAEKKTEAEFYMGIRAGDLVSDHSELVKANTVLRRVVEALKLYERPVDYEKQYATPLKKAFIDYRLKDRKKEPGRESRFIAAMGQLSASINIFPIGTSRLFYITVTDFNPAMAVKIANSLSRSYVIFDLIQNIEELKLKYGEKHSTVQLLKEYVEQIKETLDGELIPDIEALGPASVKIVAQAETAYPKKNVSPKLLMGFSFFVGIFLAVAFAVLLEYTDNTLKSADDIVRNLELPVLGIIPHRKPQEELLISKITSKHTRYVRSLEILSEQLSLLMKDKKMKTMLITDIEGSGAAAAINVNIGVCLSKSACRVLIIDADLRTSSLSGLLELDHDKGLSDFIEGKAAINDVVHSLDQNLDILPSGSTELNPVTLLDSSAMSAVVSKAKEKYDLVFINCPNLKHYTDPVVVSSITDTTLLVINAGEVKRQIIDISIAPLRQKEVNITGAILNNYKHIIPEIIYKKL